MCRFALYLGPELPVSALVTEPQHSLINQSHHSRETVEPLNGDGFGIAWRVPGLDGEMPVFRSVSPAWSNMNLRNLARVTRSRCILAHVRAASPGLPVIELNCHPFVHGEYALMHNGSIAQFHQMKRALLGSLTDEAFAMIRGSTDSEHFFALFCDEARNQPRATPLERIRRGLVGAIARVEALRRKCGVHHSALLNVVVADGRRAVVSRYVSEPDRENANSLYVNAGRRYVCEDGVCRMLDAGRETRSVVVVSEPLGEGPGWREVPVNHLAVIDEQLEVSYEPIAFPDP